MFTIARSLRTNRIKLRRNNGRNTGHGDRCARMRTTSYDRQQSSSIVFYKVDDGQRIENRIGGQEDGDEIGESAMVRVVSIKVLVISSRKPLG